MPAASAQERQPVATGRGGRAEPAVTWRVGPFPAARGSRAEGLGARGLRGGGAAIVRARRRGSSSARCPLPLPTRFLLLRRGRFSRRRPGFPGRRRWGGCPASSRFLGNAARARAWGRGGARAGCRGNQAGCGRRGQRRWRRAERKCRRRRRLALSRRRSPDPDVGVILPALDQGCVL